MAGKDSPACEDPLISTPCNQTLCILIQTMEINSYTISLLDMLNDPSQFNYLCVTFLLFLANAYAEPLEKTHDKIFFNSNFPSCKLLAAASFLP
jgi:hypothetical protein